MGHIGPSGEARELYFFAVNAEPLNRFLQASFRTLAKHHSSGRFDDALAKRQLFRNTEDLARDYAARHSVGDDWRNLFSLRDRDTVAGMLLEFWRLHWLPNYGNGETHLTE